MDQAEMHQLMLERMQRCEEALRRAEAGQADKADWDLIWFECGLKKEKEYGLSS